MTEVDWNVAIGDSIAPNCPTTSGRSWRTAYVVKLKNNSRASCVNDQHVTIIDPRVATCVRSQYEFIGLCLAIDFDPSVARTIDDVVDDRKARANPPSTELLRIGRFMATPLAVLPNGPATI